MHRLLNEAFGPIARPLPQNCFRSSIAARDSTKFAPMMIPMQQAPILEPCCGLRQWTSQSILRFNQRQLADLRLAAGG
jgi:hypothetical protein